MGGYPGLGPRLLCPGNRKYHDLHEEISNKQTQISYNGQFGFTALPRSVIAELQADIKEVLKKFANLKPDVITLVDNDNGEEKTNERFEKEK